MSNMETIANLLSSLFQHASGRVDELFGRVLSLMARYMGGGPLKRKRNCTEQSLTAHLKRPNFMVLLRNALLFKVCYLRRVMEHAGGGAGASWKREI